jgi:hypothetical protein
MFSMCFHFQLFLSGVVLSSRRIMASLSNDKGKKPMEEDYQDLKLKEEQVAGGSRARDPTFVGSMNAGRAFSHNMQGPTLPVLDLNFMSVIKDGLLVTDELCAQYRVLEREIQILQEENLRLRRMLELFLGPRMILPPPSKE